MLLKTYEKIMAVIAFVLLHISVIVFYAYSAMDGSPIIKIGIVIFGVILFAYVLYVFLSLFKDKTSMVVLKIIYFIVLFIAILVQCIGLMFDGTFMSIIQ